MLKMLLTFTVQSLTEHELDKTIKPTGVSSLCRFIYSRNKVKAVAA